MTNQNIIGQVPSGYNYIINPCFEVNQRGVASVNTNGAYPVDQWRMGLAGSSLVASQQSFTVGQTDVPGEPNNYLRVVVTSSAGAGNMAYVETRIEFVRTLAGRNATLSFYAKADAAKPIAIEISQNFGSGGSDQVTAIGVNKITLSANLAKYTATVNIPSISGKTIGTADALRVIFWLDAGSNWDARTDSLGQQSGTFEFANVKLEAGSVATPFVVPTYAGELQKCQRYYQTSYDGVIAGTYVNHAGSINWISGSNEWDRTSVVFPVKMRVAPTVTIYSTDTGTSGKLYCTTNATDYNAMADSINSNGFIPSLNNQSVTANKILRCHYTASAEL